MFRRDIRRYNCALCMASMQATEIQFPSNPSVFKIRGEVHRFVGPMHACFESLKFTDINSMTVIYYSAT